MDSYAHYFLNEDFRFSTEKGLYPISMQSASLYFIDTAISQGRRGEGSGINISAIMDEFLHEVFFYVKLLGFQPKTGSYPACTRHSN